MVAIGAAWVAVTELAEGAAEAFTAAVFVDVLLAGAAAERVDAVAAGLLVLDVDLMAAAMTGSDAKDGMGTEQKKKQQKKLHRIQCVRDEERRKHDASHLIACD